MRTHYNIMLELLVSYLIDSQITHEKFFRRLQCKSRDRRYFQIIESGMRVYMKHVMVMGLE